MEQKQTQKPFILEMDEAKEEIIRVINNAIQVHKVPYYLLSLILESIYRDIQIGAQNELIMAKEQMEVEQ
jgi:hypothetical protein